VLLLTSCALLVTQFGKPLYSTRIILNDLNPVWEETCVLLLTMDEVKTEEGTWARSNSLARLFEADSILSPSFRCQRHAMGFGRTQRRVSHRFATRPRSVLKKLLFSQ
jgi:hypothetical protein